MGFSCVSKSEIVADDLIVVYLLTMNLIFILMSCVQLNGSFVGGRMPGGPIGGGTSEILREIIAKMIIEGKEYKLAK